MGGLFSRLCGKANQDTPGDKAFDTGEKEYGEYKGFQVSQRNSPAGQALLDKVIESYNSATEYYRKTNDPNLGAAIINLAAVKWESYLAQSAKEIEMKKEAGPLSGKLLDEVIQLDDEVLALWKAPEAKPDGQQYLSLLSNLARAYRERFIRTKQSSDAAKAVELYTETFEFTKAEKSTKLHVEAVMDLGSTYWTWYSDPSSSASRKDKQLDDAIRHLKAANDLSQNQYPDIQYTCLYTLAWINHYRFETQEELKPPSPTPDYLNDAVDFYRSVLQIGMPRDDARYAKALWFVPVLLFHRYERDKLERDLQEAKTRAEDALRFGTSDAERLKSLKAIQEYDLTASPEKAADVHKVVRRSTMSSYRSQSAEYAKRQSTMMGPVFELNPADSRYDAGADGKGENSDQVGISGVGMLTNEPTSDI